MVSEETDQRERVDMVEGSESTVADQHTAKAPSLKARLAAIRDEAFGIGKDTIKMKSKAGVEFTIKGHTVEAVLSEMRPLLSKHGVDITPNLVERTYTGNRCDVLIDFLFERTDDSDEQRTIRWAGAGTDDGDKGFSKAGTNALKEMLKKRFLITDRDDAKEEEDKVEHRTDDAVHSAALAKSNAQRKAAIEKWAKAFKAALETATTPDAVDRLKRDNREQMESDDLPDITRDFFNTLISDRKAELSDGFPGDK